MNTIDPMQMRSTALRRMGIVEWLPRGPEGESPVEVVAGDSAHAAIHSVRVAGDAEVGVNAAPAVQLPRNVAEADSSSPAMPTRSVEVVVAAPTEATSARKDTPASQSATTNLPSLRARVLRAGHQTPILVLALAEKNQRDALLHPDTTPGALLHAMLGTLPAPATVALIGVERGEPIAVPATILVLGERSARALLGNDVALPLRGRVHLFGQSRVVVSYHPDEVRQNGSLKRLVWDDLRLLAGLLPSVSESH